MPPLDGLKTLPSFAVLTLNMVRQPGPVTACSLYDEEKDLSYISLKLDTGRTHQIRVHMSYIGHPFPEISSITRTTVISAASPFTLMVWSLSIPLPESL